MLRTHEICGRRVSREEREAERREGGGNSPTSFSPLFHLLHQFSDTIRVPRRGDISPVQPINAFYTQFGWKEGWTKIPFLELSPETGAEELLLLMLLPGRLQISTLLVDLQGSIFTSAGKIKLLKSKQALMNKML